jgi:hypothetical protein
MCVALLHVITEMLTGCPCSTRTDRQAQRAIRERNKNLIEDLQNQVLELESQEYYKEFKRVEAENADLKARMAVIMSQCQGVLAPLQGQSYLCYVWVHCQGCNLPNQWLQKLSPLFESATWLTEFDSC